MTIGYAIHSIMLKDSEIAPGTVAEFSDDMFDELEPRGAIREASPQEVAVYNAIKASEAAPVAETASPERLELEAKAKALGVKFQKNTSDDTLRERIAAAEKAATPSLDV